MKKEIIKGLGDIVGDMAKGAGGKSSTKNRKSGDMLGNMADTIIDTISGKLGGGGGGHPRGPWWHHRSPPPADSGIGRPCLHRSGLPSPPGHAGSSDLPWLDRRRQRRPWFAAGGGGSPFGFGGGPAQQQVKGSDLVYELGLTIQEISTGTRKTITFRNFDGQIFASAPMLKGN